MEKNVIKHSFKITKTHRNQKNNHSSLCLWFTGLSGSGKSSIANELEGLLYSRNIKTYTLDGDNVRYGLNSDLSFSPEDRKENIRRIGHLTNLMVDAGLVVLATFVSPYIEDRDFVRKLIGNKDFVEVFVNTSLDECIRRDTKGLYNKAINGEIPNMSGYNAPYEAPLNPEIIIETENNSVKECADQILEIIINKIKLIS